MSRFCPLYSSSKGNSVYLAGGGTGLLVDAGVSFRRLKEALARRNVELSSLQGVLVTHEHSDHISGLAMLLKHVDLPLFASAGTLDYLACKGVLPPNAKVGVCDGTVQIGDIEVQSFPTPHDASESIGFRFSMPDQRTIAVATDLGHVTDEVRKNLESCDLVMLESNYDRGMLDCSPYPYYLKRRIKSNTGHLSNEACAAEIMELVRSGSTRFVLGHLSEQNNLPQIAYQMVQSALGSQRMQENLDYILQVAPARGPGEVMVF